MAACVILLQGPAAEGVLSTLITFPDSLRKSTSVTTSVDKEKKKKGQEPVRVAKKQQMSPPFPQTNRRVRLMAPPWLVARFSARA